MSSQPFFIPSLIFIVISVPIVLGLVPRNRIYGVRTRTTLSSDEIWYPANRHGGIVIIMASAAYLLLAGLAPYHRGPPDDFGVWLIHVTVFAGSLVLALLSIRRKIRSLDGGGPAGRR